MYGRPAQAGIRRYLVSSRQLDGWSPRASRDTPLVNLSAVPTGLVAPRKQGYARMQEGKGLTKTGRPAQAGIRLYYQAF